MNFSTIDWTTVAWWLLLIPVAMLAFRQFAVLAAKSVAKLEERFVEPVEPAQTHRALSPAGGKVHRFGQARTPIDPEGRVVIQGETWNAVAESPIDAGEPIEVIDAEGLILRVRPLPAAASTVEVASD